MAKDRFGEALALHRSGRLDEAARLYRRVLTYEPRHAGALHMLGTVHLAQQRYDEAASLLARAVEAAPEVAAGHYNLGCALQALGEARAAADAYDRTIAIHPGHVAAHLNLSGVLLLLRHPKEAFEAARRAAELDPTSAPAHCNAGLALKAAGSSERAEEMFRAAIALDANHAESLHNLGNLIRQFPGRDEEARALLARVVRLRPRMIEPRIAIAQMLRDGCEGVAAAAELEHAASINPDDPLVRLALAMSPLQALYRTEAERAAARAAYGVRLGELAEWARAGGPTRLASLADAAGMVQPFYLPYAGGIDRDLQSVYGTLMADAALARHGQAELASPASGERIRVGFVSGYMRDHSNWKIPLRGWMAGLDRDRFEVFGYYTGDITHPQTEEAASLCSRFLRGPRTTAEWRAAILADRPHVLIYPETGMDGAAFRLASMRLAPMQCVSWGHPITSGLPTMDAFLSSAAMEPDDAQTHYTERLVRLPGLGIDYELPSPAPSRMTRASLGLPEGTLFFCGQALFKYVPRYDHVLARIAQHVPDARFVFVDAPQGRQIKTLMRARLAASLDVERHCLFLDRLDQAGFVALSGLCDVVLDSIDWSGCNSTLECLPLGTPIVTLPGRTMRARHTAAILSLVGETFGIASDEDDYVRIASMLAHDAALRSNLRERLARASRSVGHNTHSVRALEAFVSSGLCPEPRQRQSPLETPD